MHRMNQNIEASHDTITEQIALLWCSHESFAAQGKRALSPQRKVRSTSQAECRRFESDHPLHKDSPAYKEELVDWRAATRFPRFFIQPNLPPVGQTRGLL